MTISSDDSVWITQQIQISEQAIAAINAAIIALASGAQSYELDTGQTRQRVTKANLDGLGKMLTMYEERRTKYRSALGLPNTVGKQIRVTPAF
jgi:hypothetical protein